MPRHVVRRYISALQVRGVFVRMRPRESAATTVQQECIMSHRQRVTRQRERSYEEEPPQQYTWIVYAVGMLLVGGLTGYVLIEDSVRRGTHTKGVGALVVEHCPRLRRYHRYTKRYGGKYRSVTPYRVDRSARLHGTDAEEGARWVDAFLPGG